MVVGRVARMRSMSLRIQRSSGMPRDFMLRRIWLSDSSKAKYSARSPRLQAAFTKEAATLDLPVPAVPVTSTLLARKNPWRPSIASRPEIPLETRSDDAL